MVFLLSLMVASGPLVYSQYCHDQLSLGGKQHVCETDSTKINSPVASWIRRTQCKPQSRIIFHLFKSINSHLKHFQALPGELLGPGALPRLIVFMASDTSSIVAPLSSVLFPSRQSFMFSASSGTTAMKSDMEKTFWSLLISC